MVAQDTVQHPAALEEKPDQFHDQDPYEAEETLSLCDLPTHSDSAHWDDYSKEYQSSSFDNDEDNFFEFFSEEFTASTYAAGKDIIFCGKLIPYNKETPKFLSAAEKSQKSQEIMGSTKRIETGIFRSWRSKISKPPAVMQVKDHRSIKSSLSFPTTKNYRKCELNKVSILSSTPSKSKWYLYMFGMTRFPTEMEMTDIRTRQSRRNPSTMFRSCDEGSDDQLSPKGKKGRSKNKRIKGLWSLLRAVGCGSSSHANAVDKAGLV